MSVHLGPLYHWSPRGRLGGIKRLGLVPGRRNFHGPVVHHLPGQVWDGPGDPPEGEFRQEAVCLGTSPAFAWNYSHGTWKSVGTFDLWEVDLEPEDEVEVLRMWGSQIVEVRVYNRIRKRRLIWVGERTVS